MYLENGGHIFMNEQLLKMNGLSLKILEELSYESHLGISLKKNLHYFDKASLMLELAMATEWEVLRDVLFNS